MKKYLCLWLAIVATFQPIFAQQFKTEKSAAFEEPEFGWNKLLQLKNGNTFFFHSTRRDGIEVTVYNKQRKQIYYQDTGKRLLGCGQNETFEDSWLTRDKRRTRTFCDAVG